MARRRLSYSEKAWETMPPHILRCVGSHPNGAQCKRRANDGTNVCDLHGAAAPQVRQRAAERVMYSAERAVEVVLEVLNDTSLAAPVRLKAAQDVLDRQGLVAAQVVKILPGEQDPLTQLFEGLLSRDDALEPEYEYPALPPAGDYDGPDEDGAYTGPIVGDPDYWDGPATDPNDADVIDAEVVESQPPERQVSPIPGHVRQALNEGRL